MRTSSVILIIAASIWLAIEGALILRDRRNSKGTTKIDRMSRLFNFISLDLALSSPFLSLLMPALRFNVDEAPSVTWIGTSIMCLGFALRYWSILVLGKYFRTTVELEKGQKVVQNGPYRYIRHPSYGGMILFCLGYGLTSQHWLSMAIAFTAPTLALLYRIGVEEKVFVKEMGKKYTEYQSRTKKLIPGIW